MTRKPVLSMVVAMSFNRTIGKEGEVPWKLPSDLKRFAKITKGHPVIMGRKTYESIINQLGHPLPNRTNIILSRNYRIADEFFEECIVASSPEQAISLAEKYPGGSKEIFVIGGAEIYRQFLPLTDKIYMTLIHVEIFGCDVMFPDEFIWKDWETVKCHIATGKDGDQFDSTFGVMRRRVSKNNYLNFAHARKKNQKMVMDQIEKDGVCPFCVEHFEKYHSKPILRKGKFWIATENMAPYDGTEAHLLFVYKEHITDIGQMNPEAAGELIEIASSLWSNEYPRLMGGVLFMRFGDPDRTGSSVAHLHAQLIAGESSRCDKNSTGLKVKLGYKKK